LCYSFNSIWFFILFFILFFASTIAHINGKIISFKYLNLKIYIG
jgi:hypothetical protein